MNNMRTIKLLCIVLTLLVAAPAAAQDNGITAQKEKILKKRAKEKVGQFCDYVAFIASKDKKYKTRLWYVDQAYKLFVNNAKAIYDADNPKLKIRDATIMQVTSLRSKRPRNVYLRTYLPRLANLQYPKVIVTSSDVSEMRLSEMQKIGDGIYTCTVYFYQYFIGLNGDQQILYKDRTEKRVQVFIVEDKTEDGTEYIVRLGDIYADTTESF